MKQYNLSSLFPSKITRTNGVNPRHFFLGPTHQWKRLAPQPSSAAPPTLPPGTCQKMAYRNPPRGGKKERHNIFLLTFLWILKLFYIVLETRATFFDSENIKCGSSASPWYEAIQILWVGAQRCCKRHPFPNRQHCRSISYINDYPSATFRMSARNIGIRWYKTPAVELLKLIFWMTTIYSK
jgi:hypothetical protein